MTNISVRAFCLALVVAGASLGASAADEFAASFEVRVDRNVDRSPMGFGFSLASWAPFAEGKLAFSVKGPAVAFGPQDLTVGFDTAFRTGLWHHVAVAYREQDNRARVWVDGTLMGVAHTCSPEPVGVAAFQKAPKAGKDFPGVIRNIRTWQKVPPAEELLPSGVLDPIREAALAAEASFVRGFDGRAPQNGLLPVAIDRFAREKHVPFRTPSDAAVLKELRLAAAQGEIEDASFLVLPFKDFKGFHVRVTDLKGTGGSIPASAFDVRLVKNWLQCRWGWTTYKASGRFHPQLTPELLVHDDRLVIVDPETHENMLRLSYPEGERYVSVSAYGEKSFCQTFNYNLEPVHDADSLLPYDLAKGAYSQLWLTFRCPERQVAGDYVGAVVLSADGKDVGIIPLVVKIHPFALPKPGCHHDPTYPFIETWMGHYSLKEKICGNGSVAGGCNVADAIRRLQAEFRNMAEHNCGYPWTLSFGADDDLSDWQLDVQKAAGCEMKPLFGDIGVSYDFALWGVSAPSGVSDISVEANLEVWRREMTAYSNKVERASARVERKLGHRDIVYCGYDEAPPGVVRREFPFFATLGHFGGRSFTTSGVDSESAFMTDLTDVPGDFTAERSRRWHECGGRVFSYAAPHSGPECPDIWRRSRGLGSYFADLDGLNEYVWYEGQHVWNEFLDGPDAEYRNFNMVYPTADGVLDTVQWEAVREGLDDIRYFTLLARLSAAAIGTKDAALVREGRRAVRWMETCDWQKGGLDELRLIAAERIASLRGRLSAAGLDVESAVDRFARPAKLELRLPRPDPQADSAALEQTAAGYEKRRFCDLAFAFYRAAAAKASGERKAELLLRAAENAMRYRDRAAARAALDEGVAMGKEAGANFKPLRVRQALLACETVGFRTPDAKSVNAADETVRKYGTHADLYRLLCARLAAGDASAAAEGLARLFETSRSIKFEIARSAGEAYEAAGDPRRAAGWFRKAADLDVSQRFDMLCRVAANALAANDRVAALDAFTQSLKCVNQTEQASRYAAVQAQIAALSKIVSDASRSPLVDPESNDDESISLDEEL